VFAIQEDIARSIAASLHMTLGLKPGEDLVNQRAIDPELHTQYLRARNLVRTRLPKQTADGIRLLSEVVARAPNYAPAWASLAFAYEGALLIDPDINAGNVEKAKPVIENTLQKLEAAGQQALKLDPNNATALCALGIVLQDRRDVIGAVEVRQRALTSDPDDPECLNSPFLAGLGFVKQTLPLREHLMALEPFVPVYRGTTARILFADGQTDAAIAILKENSGQGAVLLLAQIYASQGRYREAADLLDAGAKIAATDFSGTELPNVTAAAARILRAAPATPPNNDRPELGRFDWVYLYTALPERFMNMHELWLRMGVFATGQVGLQWAPAYHDIRQTARFKQWVRDTGILAYWRAKGWPPQCHPTTGDDFACE
jgi:tetratricopeptide (TPR) repeat protein